jgi:hypothetical protein
MSDWVRMSLNQCAILHFPVEMGKRIVNLGKGFL